MNPAQINGHPFFQKNVNYWIIIGNYWTPIFLNELWMNY